MSAFPTTVATDADLYIAVNSLSTQLTDNPLTSGATTVNVVSTTGFPTVGFISIDNEIIKYTGTTGTSFTGCTRGADGTSATSHVQNSQVFHNVIAAHHNALKDDLIAVESYLSTHIGLTTAVTSAEFERLSGVTSSIQTQLNAKATDTLVVHLAGSETITGAKTFQDQKLLLQETGGTDVVTISVAALATGRLLTIPDPGAAASFVMTEGSATINGAKTFSSDIACTNNSISVTKSRSGDNVQLSTYNTSNTAASDALVQIEVGGTSGGDPRILYLIDSGQAWTAGVDNSDADAYVISKGTALGTSNVMRIDATTLAVAIHGTNTNDSAAAGFVGEYIESASNTTNNHVTSGNFENYTTISLTAGDWDVYGVLEMDCNGATVTNMQIAISAFSGNTTTDHSASQNLFFEVRPFGTTDIHHIAVPHWRLSLTSTTTVYLKQRFTYSAGTPRADAGRISARRIR